MTVDVRTPLVARHVHRLLRLANQKLQTKLKTLFVAQFKARVLCWDNVVVVVRGIIKVRTDE